MILDMHADIFTDIFNKRLLGDSDIIKKYHLDKFNKGGVNGGIFVFWLEPRYNDYSNLKVMMNFANKEADIANDYFSIAKNYTEYIDSLKSGKLTVMMNLEGAKSIEDDINRIYEIYNFGIRFLSFTWNEENKLASGVKGNRNVGLSELGKEYLKRAQELGIMIDVSHANDKTFYDILNHTQRPVIASHSNCRKICNVGRNLLDDQLKLIKDTGGIVGINAFRNFIDENPNKQDVIHLANHIEHMVDLIGIDSVCFGLDYCDYLDDEDEIIENGLENVSKTQNIIVELKNRGFNIEDIDKISYKNFLRFMKENINN